MHRSKLTLLVVAAFSLGAAACAGARPPENVIPESDAQAAALAAVPGATVQDRELEKEGGRWIYSFDLVVSGREGIEEIHVDALTGEVVGREHEGAAEERGEADEEGTEPGEELPEARARTSNPAPVAEPYEPAFDASAMADRIDNPFFPLVPGTTFRYANANEGETGAVTVTDERRTVMGVPVTVVLDRVYADGELEEETYDWYAQDSDGNVWYMGEDTREMEEGQTVSTSGSWEAGRQGALPGIIMLARPTRGRRYRQEYRRGAAEDVGRVLEQGVRVTVPYGSFSDCIRTEDTTPLEPAVRETKVYCRGVGLVLEDEGAGSRNELVAVEKSGAAAGG